MHWFFLMIPVFISANTAKSDNFEVLNLKNTQQELSRKAPTKTLDERLKLLTLKIKGQFFDSENRINYSKLVQSPEYQELQALTYKLQEFDLSILNSKEKKLAFWINIYNTLVIHGTAHFQPEKSVKDVKDFFGRTAYNISHLLFSLDIIEHGMLRANRRRPYTLFKLLKNSDPRLRFGLSDQEFDPRIHFTLNCGSSSCPPISFYNPDNINSQLETAARGFIQTETFIRDGAVWTSKILDWYSGDFKPSARRFLSRYVDDKKLKDALIEEKLSLKFSDYNWNLNSAEGVR